MADTYTCDSCGGTFDKQVSDEAAYTEARENFGTDPSTDPTMGIVCDDCWKLMTKVAPPEEWKANGTPCVACGHPAWIHLPEEAPIMGRPAIEFYATAPDAMVKAHETLFGIQIVRKQCMHTPDRYGAERCACEEYREARP